LPFRYVVLRLVEGIDRALGQQPGFGWAVAWTGGTGVDGKRSCPKAYSGSGNGLWSRTKRIGCLGRRWPTAERDSGGQLDERAEMGADATHRGQGLILFGVGIRRFPLGAKRAGLRQEQFERRLAEITGHLNQPVTRTPLDKIEHIEQVDFEELGQLQQ